MKKKTLAILTPEGNAYSETFIQAHKHLPFNIKYYYNGLVPENLEGGENLKKLNMMETLRLRFNRKFTNEEFALIQSFKREKVDCILAEYGPTACAILKVAKFVRLPLVVHFHGFDASRKDIIATYGQKYREVFAYASKVMVVSKSMQRELFALGCPSEKLILNTYGPNVQFFKNSPLYNTAQFVSIGRFVDKKAPHHTIGAFKKVAANYSEATLIMVGDGFLLDQCRRLVTSLDLNDKIKFAGILDKDSIGQILEKSIAFVQHSVVADNGDAEGTPVAVLEAQAAGLPVISTLHAGIPDVVIHNETGLLSAEHDIDAMAANMMHILSTPGLAEQLGSAGKKRVIENFTQENHLMVLKEAIENALV
jgi:colanic acid/amylovoran biosynthesis glycosyltransferase